GSRSIPTTCDRRGTSMAVCAQHSALRDLRGNDCRAPAMPDHRSDVVYLLTLVSRGSPGSTGHRSLRSTGGTTTGAWAHLGALVGTLRRAWSTRIDCTSSLTTKDTFVVAVE